MQNTLELTIQRTSDNQVVASVCNFPTSDTVLRPDEIRALASALMQAAHECEGLTVTATLPEQRSFGLDSLSAAERRVIQNPNGYGDIEIETYRHNGHKVSIFQNAALTDGRPTFFAMLGSAVVLGQDAYCIQDARERANIAAERRKPRSRVASQ